MMRKRDILLTGLGPLCSQGAGAADFALNMDLPCAAMDAGEPERYLRTPKTYLDRCSALLLSACNLALTDAGFADGASDAGGVYMATDRGCLSSTAAFMHGINAKGVRLANTILFSHSYINTPASLAAIEYGLRGPQATFCHGPEAGLSTICLACGLLAEGAADFMLVGGGDALEGCPQEAPAEGAAMLLLESGAAARGASIRCRVLDWGVMGPGEALPDEAAGADALLHLGPMPGNLTFRRSLDRTPQLEGTGAASGPLLVITAALLLETPARAEYSRLLLLDNRGNAPAFMLLGRAER